MNKKAPAPAERVTLEPRSPWWGEHRSRYHFAAKRVRNLTVLDIACGTGFGSRLLAEAGADLVVGVDLAWDALLETNSQVKDEEPIKVLQADGTALPFPTSSMDVVVSFETLEHIHDDERFIAEIARVTKEDGVAYISTPNSSLSPKTDGRPTNPFHVREYTPDALDRLLGRSFKTVHLLGQQVAPYFPVCPFWQPEAVLDDSPGVKARVLLWKLQNRLPYQVKERMARVLHNRSFLPGEYDFIFEPGGIARSHVLVAECRH